MRNFGSTESPESIESILKEGSILKCILKCCRFREKLRYKNVSYNLGHIFSADVSNAFSWKPSMTVNEKSDPVFSHLTK